MDTTQNNQTSSFNLDLNIPFECENGYVGVEKSLTLNTNIPFECGEQYVGMEKLPDLNVIPQEEYDLHLILPEEDDLSFIPLEEDALNLVSSEDDDLNLIPSEEDDAHINISPEEDDIQLDMGLQAPLEESNIMHHNIATPLEALCITTIGANDGLPQPQMRKRNLTNVERKAVYEMLLQKSVDGKLKRGVTKIVASKFSTTMQTVQRIWRRSNYGEGSSETVCSRRPRNCGRKRIELDFERFRQIPVKKRTTFESLAFEMNMNKTTLFRRLRSGVFRRHSNAIKPHLKDANKISRMRFCISMLDGGSIPHDPTFTDMFNIIHIDEKWFYMTKRSENYYLLPDEEIPLRTCKSKNFIGKVMFLAAVARPRFDPQGNVLFSGKIGLFPFVTRARARRSSSNRAAGTIETKPITSITKDIVRSFLIEKVIPAIKEKWPREDINKPIFIQQDNARTHIRHDDEEFCRVSKQDGFDIRLICQPPNSPDLNVLDLGFFRAIQSIQHQESPKSVDELVAAVKKAYDEFSTSKSNYIFLTLQSCMIEIMREKGSNKYKIPHLGKDRLAARGELPIQLKCPPELVEEVLNYLSSDTQ